MGMVTLILVLAAVSSLVCVMIERGGDPGAAIRDFAVRVGRATGVAILRSARASSAVLLKADSHLRHHRPVHDLRFAPRPAVVAVDGWPSRLLALIELLILALLTGAAMAAALAGLAWGAVRLMI
jgi:hypothetical protein